MKTVDIIGIDLAKRSFQLHGSSSDGSVIFRKKMSRDQMTDFLSQQPNCQVALEACATSHYWGREISKLGHEVKLIPPIYVKPFVKRQKNDASDAEAIAEAASRPTMRFVAIKSEDKQAQSMLFRTRELLVGQRTQTVNALRGHLAEFGILTAQGILHVYRLEQAIEEQTDLPDIVRGLGRLYLAQIADYDDKIKALDKDMRSNSKNDPEIVQLMTMPGIGPITALAISTFAPPMENFKSGRDFSAWLGLVPRQKSTGGKQRLGRTTKMGQRDIRRLLIIGAMSVVNWASRKKVAANSWLLRMIARKPRMLVATALANKMARMIWAMMTKNESYRAPASAAN